MKKEIYFVTGNKNKLREALEILKDYKIINKNIELSEIQADPVSIARHKAKEAYKKLKRPCFVDDVALCFNALNGLPGEYIKFFLEKLGREKLYKLLDGFDDKTGYALCVIGYHDGKNVHIFEGKTEGTIVKARGETEFGWDPLFLPKGFSKTYAEMKAEEKNKISHRFKAFEKFKRFLTK